VVTDGTAEALRDLPGPEVSGKTGTAEAGTDVEHAWFVGWQDDLAFAIFVQDGGSGSGTAVPLAGRFLRDLAG
jgi:cell division protein FtsI/penicillin-binding protein 2